MSKGLEQCDKCDYFISVEEAYNQGKADGYEDGYKKGIQEGVNELSDLIDRLLFIYDKETYEDLSESFKRSAELVKGAKE